MTNAIVKAAAILLSCSLTLTVKGEDDVVAGENRLKALTEQLKTTNDRVKIASEMARDKHPGCYTLGMKLLEESWEDPRTEEVLAEIAKGEPKVLREGFLTQAGQAASHLYAVRAKKEIKKLLSGKNTPDEKFAAINEVFEKHPEWSKLSTLDEEKQTLVSQLIHLAADVGGAKSMDLVFKVGLGSIAEMTEFIGKYPEASIQVAKQRGAEAVLNTWGAIEGLASLKRPESSELIETWLRTAKDDRSIEVLIDALNKSSGEQNRLLKLLKDERETVVYRSIGLLSRYHPNQDTVKALKELIETSKSQKVIRQARGALKSIEADNAIKERR